MPFDFIRQAWDTPCQSHTQKLVLAALAGYADKDGKCWPSIEALSRRCNLSERATYAQIELLKRAGLISVQSGGGRHHVSTYRLRLGNPAPETLNGKQCLSNSECGAINPERRSINPARRAPQLPGTASELPRGMEKANPHIFPAEYKDLIKDAQAEIESIKGRGILNDSDKSEIRELLAKIKAWKKSRFNAK